VRGKGLLESRLDRIRGVGRKRRLALLRRFGSIDEIKKASLEEIAGVEGMNRAVAEEVLKALKGGDGTQGP
jgi:excinuclease ABC subunit C